MWIARLLRLAIVIVLVSALSANAGVIQVQDLDRRQSFTHAPPPTPPIQLLPTRRPQASTVISPPSVQPAGQPANAYIRIMSLVYSLAQQYDIDAQLVRAIIAVESNFNVHAVSHAGAQGLMQLMPGTAARYNVQDPFDPRANIEGGLRYLTALRQRFRDDLHRVLAAYNAGEGAVERYGGVPPYRETRRYIAQVLTRYKRYTAASKIYRYRTVQGSILFTDTPR